MKLFFWTIGKQNETYVKEGIQLFTARIKHYYDVDWKIIVPDKNWNNLEIIEQKNKESNDILNLLDKQDFLILLDETGQQYNSIEFANFLEKKIVAGHKNIIFLIGGAYGVNEELKKRANFIWSFSKLVFPHQLVRLILTEQVYRACTILKNQNYHHQ